MPERFRGQRVLQKQITNQGPNGSVRSTESNLLQVASESRAGEAQRVVLAGKVERAWLPSSHGGSARMWSSVADYGSDLTFFGQSKKVKNAT